MAAADFPSYRCHRVRDPSDPWFAKAYATLASYFGARGELEAAEVLARRLERGAAALPGLPGSRATYELHCLIRAEGDDDPGDALMAVRDHAVIERPGAETGPVVHLSHAWVAPAHRGLGLGRVLRSLAVDAARNADPDAQPDPGAGGVLVAEMENPATCVDSGDRDAARRRLAVYERDGFRVVDPAAFAYAQPSFVGGDPLPLWLVVRGVDGPVPEAVPAEAAMDWAAALHASYALDLPDLDIAAAAACTGVRGADANTVACLPPARCGDGDASPGTDDGSMRPPMDRADRLPVFHDAGSAADLGPGHRMPIDKFRLTAEALRSDPGLSPRLDWPAVEPLRRDQLARVHTSAYLDAIVTGEPRSLAESQKFPWTPGLYGSVCLTGGALLGACRAALRRETQPAVAAALVSGFHHAHADHGEGFCTFNSLVVAADELRAAGDAQRVAILDLDLHYGNGTAALCDGRPHLRALSIYGNDYRDNEPFADVTVRRHRDGPNHRSVALPAGAGRASMLAVLARELSWLVAEGRPDLLIYQAGADPLSSDPYSPLDLSAADLRARDAVVFGWARALGLPVVWVLAGGYTPDIDEVVGVHVGTFRAWFRGPDTLGG